MSDVSRGDEPGAARVLRKDGWPLRDVCNAKLAFVLPAPGLTADSSCFESSKARLQLGGYCSGGSCSLSASNHQSGQRHLVRISARRASANSYRP